MSFLSALMVYSSVNNLSVVSGRLSKGHNTLALLSLADTTLGYIGDLQLKLFNL